MSDDWQSQKFRQSVISKINEMVQNSGQDPYKNAGVMESHIFKKSRNRDEYLGLVAKLFTHFKEMANRKPQQPPPNPEIGQNNMMQDPLNALQNLASQGNRNPQMMPMPNCGPNGPNPNQMSGGPGPGPVPASNLLQSLNQQRPGQQMQQMQGIRGQMPMVGGPNAAGNGGPGTQQQQQMLPQMGGNMNAASSAGGNQQMMQGNASSGGGVPNAGQNAGGGNNMNMQQQMQNQMNISGMNHQQINQIMNARMNQSGGPNVPPQTMQGMSPNMQQNVNSAMHPNVSGAGSQSQQVGGGMQSNAGQSGNLSQMLNMPPGMQQKPNMPMSQPNSGNQMFNRVGAQQQFLRQSPSPASSPAAAGGLNTAAAAAQQQMQQQQQANVNQQQQQQQQSGAGGPQNGASGNGSMPVPNQQMIPSPALVPSSSPQMSNLMQNQQRNGMRQSPSAPLNTPGQVASNSPFNPQEDQLYREKYKQLTKYIEPLKRMVAKIGHDGTNNEKMTKMSKLLEILSNPAQRVPLETLLKCEKALEKLEISSSYITQPFGKSSNPLMEVINTTLMSPIANHTLHRTFRPSMELLLGTDICGPAPVKMPKIEQKPSPFGFDIPHVLQGEIARLDPKFKVTLDPTSQNNPKLIKLVCCLDDKLLPSVPPINVHILERYPFVAPELYVSESEYTQSDFMRTVKEALVNRINNLPKCHSLSHLLDTWEMAVRQACSPTYKTTTYWNTVLGC